MARALQQLISMRMAMVANTPVMEDGEKRRVQEIRAARLQEALEKRRRLIYDQLRGLFRFNIILYVCGLTLAAFLYHRYEIHQLAMTTSSAVSTKLDTVAKTSSIHRSILNEEQEVNEAAGQN